MSTLTIGTRVRINSPRGLGNRVNGATGVVTEVVPDDEFADIKANWPADEEDISDAEQAGYVRLEESTGDFFFDMMFADALPVVNTDVELYDGPSSGPTAQQSTDQDEDGAEYQTYKIGDRVVITADCEENGLPATVVGIEPEESLAILKVLSGPMEQALWFQLDRDPEGELVSGTNREVSPYTDAKEDVA